VMSAFGLSTSPSTQIEFTSGSDIVGDRLTDRNFGAVVAVLVSTLHVCVVWLLLPASSTARIVTVNEFAAAGTEIV